jgi:hypothetical protein
MNTKNLIIAALIPFVLVACQTVSDPNRTVTTQWNSSQGVVQFRQQNIKVRGDYLANEHGQIVGEMQGNTLQGQWIEDKADRRCATAVEGRYYWGRITLTFSGTQFQGAWGYCNDAPTQAWTGKLKKG